jgi:hypothetical protein
MTCDRHCKCEQLGAQAIVITWLPTGNLISKANAYAPVEKYFVEPQGATEQPAQQH